MTNRGSQFQYKNSGVTLTAAAYIYIYVCTYVKHTRMYYRITEGQGCFSERTDSINENAITCHNRSDPSLQHMSSLAESERYAMMRYAAMPSCVYAFKLVLSLLRLHLHGGALPRAASRACLVSLRGTCVNVCVSVRVRVLWKVVGAGGSRGDATLLLRRPVG